MVSVELHRELKSLAAQRGLSLSDLVSRQLRRMLARDLVNGKKERIQ